MLPTVGHHVVDVQPGLFADSTTGTSVSRPPPGDSPGRAAPASCTSDTAAAAMARAASGISRMLGYQRLQSEPLGPELARPALPLHPLVRPLAQDWRGARFKETSHREPAGRAGLEPGTNGF